MNDTDHDNQCRWLVSFVCSPDWTTAATMAVAETSRLQNFEHSNRVSRFLSIHGALHSGAARSIARAIGDRNVLISVAWKLLALRPDDGEVIELVDNVRGIVSSVDDPRAAEARARLRVWTDVADDKYPADLDFFEAAEKHRVERKAGGCESWRAEAPPCIRLLAASRWDAAIDDLVRDMLITRSVTVPRAVVDSSDRKRQQRAIHAYANALFAEKNPESGAIALAWLMLTCEPERPSSFWTVLPPLQHLLAYESAWLSADEKQTLQRRLDVWYRAADGEFTDSDVSIFRIARVETEIDIDDGQTHDGESSAAPTPRKRQEPSVVVLAKAGAVERGLDSAWKKMIDQPVPLVVTRDAASVAAALRAEYPHAWREIGMLVQDLRDDKPVRMRPVILVGEPGSGKSRLVRRLSELLSLYSFRLDGSSAMDSMFAGTTKGWSSAHPSVPARAIATAQHANPIIMLDEIEKASESTHNGNFWNALTPLLERETSARYRDCGLDCQLDLSHVNYVATANSLDRLPAPLRDRFRWDQAARRGESVMLRRLKSLFAWRNQFVAGVWLYQENALTGERRVLKWCTGYSPVDQTWLSVRA